MGTMGGQIAQIYFELYKMEGWVFFLSSATSLLFLVYPIYLLCQETCVGGCCLLFNFFYVSCSSINQVVKHLRLQ